MTIIKGPLGALLGIVYGFGAGIMLWFVPGKDSVNTLHGSSLKHQLTTHTIYPSELNSSFLSYSDAFRICLFFIFLVPS